jgi:hypothetical protein
VEPSVLAGSLEEWLPYFRTLEERVIAAIDAAWPLCVAPLQSRKNEMTHEDHITEHLIQRLIRTKLLPGRIVYQYTLLSEADDGLVSISSNIDFVLTVGDDEDVYLACECKRLNVPYASGMRGLVGPYVDEGLMRFVSGQYSNGLPLAMMLGYVMNARSARARRGVRRAMTLRASQLGLQEHQDIPTGAGQPLRLRSQHESQTGQIIEVVHSFLDWP